jgi:hypothetical protein
LGLTVRELCSLQQPDSVREMCLTALPHFVDSENQCFPLDARLVRLDSNDRIAARTAGHNNGTGR